MNRRSFLLGCTSLAAAAVTKAVPETPPALNDPLFLFQSRVYVGPARGPVVWATIQGTDLWGKPMREVIGIEEVKWQRPPRVITGYEVAR